MNFYLTTLSKLITQPNTRQLIFFPLAKLYFFHRFYTVCYDSVLCFFPAQQISELVFSQQVRFLRKSSMNLPKALKMP
jgi:hypothetical protein